MKHKTSKVLLIVSLIGLAVIWRVINNRFMIAPNLEIVTTTSLIGGLAIGWQASLIIALGSIISSDLIIGNSSIFMFTWGSFAIIGLSASLLKRYNKQPKKQIISSIGFAMASSFGFFIITNFGVWLQGWYPMTWAGLVDCFILAIPFYRTMLIGNIILLPLATTVWQLALARRKSLIVDTNQR